VSAGKESKRKVQELLATGDLARNVHMRNDLRRQVNRLFHSVWGVGSATALEWWEAGYRTLEDAAQSPTLTSRQRAGLQHYAAMQIRIPREVRCGRAL